MPTRPSGHVLSATVLSPPRRPPATPLRRSPATTLGPERRSTPAPPGPVLCGYGPLLVVLGCYAAAAFVVPTLAPVSIIDDWVYARAVGRLVEDGVWRVPQLSAANLWFQLGWGGLFASVFGMTLGVLRAATVVLSFLGGLAMFGLCRELRVSRSRSALGAAVYLFNPLAFVLSYSFMTDPYFLALLVMAAFCFARGVRLGDGDDGGRWAMVAGSAAASMAFLVRQQGLLIPLAVVTFLVASRRVRVDLRGLRTVLPVVALPAVTLVAFQVWLVTINTVPAAQQGFASDVAAAGVDGSALLAGRLAVIQAMYVGLFVLPLALAVLPRVGRLAGQLPRRGLWAAAGIVGFTVAGVAVLTPERLMPYVPQFLNRYGVGSYDLAATPSPVVGRLVLGLLTVACAVAVAVAAVALIRGATARVAGGRQIADRRTAGAGLVASLALWQAVGTLLPSFHFADWRAPGPLGAMVSSPSLDRYILPLLPLAVVLVLWALRDVCIGVGLAWGATAVMAVVSVAGTHDSLVFQDETWKIARQAVASGVPRTQLDGGAAWNGSQANRDVLPDKADEKPVPWYVNLWSPDVDPVFVISPQPVSGYRVVEARGYSSWLPREATTLYLLRRDG